jgi:hypothetical protein
LSCLGHKFLLLLLPVETFFAVAVYCERYVRRLSGFGVTQIIEGCGQSTEGPAALNQPKLPLARGPCLVMPSTSG